MKNQKIYCMNCDEEQSYHTIKKEREVTVKDLTFKTEWIYAYCDVCGEEVYPDAVGKENDKLVFDKYRELNGLLTSDEIKSIRKKRNMSQVDLARFIKCGEKNIARYETGTIQDPVFDFLMRMVDDDDCYKTMQNLKMPSRPRLLTNREMAMTCGGGPGCPKKKSKKIAK